MMLKSQFLSRSIQILKGARTAFFSSSQNVNTKSNTNETKHESLFERFLGPNAGITNADSKVNRWTMLIPACVTHACLGAPYGWSAVSSALSREQGNLSYNSDRKLPLNIFQVLWQAQHQTGA